MLLLLQIPLTDERAWPLLGIAGLALAYVVLRPMLKRKRDPLDPKPAFSSMAQQRAVERQMQNLLVDLTEMARQISAQLDTRAGKLEALIHEADEKIATLRSLEPDPRSPRSAHSPHSPRSPGSPAPTIPSMSISSSSFPETTAAAPAASLASPLHDAIDPRHAEVYALADAGRAPRDIAAQLNRPSGEIELILALRSPRG